MTIAPISRQAFVKDATGSPPAGSVVDTYPLSPMQQGMLYHWLRDPRGGADLEHITCTLESIDISTFVRAWEQLTRRHALLRTVFRWQDADVPMQDVFDDVSLDVHEVDLRAHAPEEQLRVIDAYLGADRRRGFDFAAPPLFRLAFFRTAERRHEFVWTFPHILLDGRSFVVLIRELIETYRAFEELRMPTLAEPRPYRDFIEWLQLQNAAAASAFWSKALEGFSSPVFPDLGVVERDDSTAGFAEQQCRLSVGETITLREFAQRHDLTLNTLVQGAWALLLSRYTGTDDVVFGATRACRRTPLGGDASVNAMVGLFINTLPVRVRIPAEQSVVAWLKQIRADQVAVRVAEHTPLTQVHSVSSLPGGAPLFETMLVFENQQQVTSFDAIDPRCFNFRLREQTTFPITVHAYGENELLLRIEYARSRFDDASIARMLGHLATLLREMVEKGDRPLRALELLTREERRQLTEEWNQTPATSSDSHSVKDGYPRDTLVHELFTEHAARTPDAVAVVCGSDVLSYAELERRANSLARRMTALGVGAGTLVGLCTERSFEMVIATLAILKAGAAYVPLDPAYPAERLAHMLADARTPVILAQRQLTQSLEAALAASGAVATSVTAPHILFLDAPDPLEPASGTTAPKPDVSAESAAYVIYTSGSTGRPKGVIVPHRGIVRLVRDTNFVELGPQEAILGFAPISFDAATFEIWGALLNGGRLVLAPAGLELTSLGDVIEKHGVTTAWLTAALFQQVVETQLSQLGGLRQLLAGGDVLSAPHVRMAQSELKGCRVINGYGPTENTTFTCCYTIPSNWPANRAVPIGRPVAHSRVYVLDADRQPVPIGVPGELYAGGDGVALGYLNRPDLTAERFVPDPFTTDPAARLYKTGDRVRWRADGVVEFLGRFDNQVKIRGFRVEPGEIEARLLAHPHVRQALVVTNDDLSERRLIAYLVARSADRTPAGALRDHLLVTLPSYMVPSAFVWMDELPLSTNGKVDRKALPAPERDMSADEVVPPRDETEARVLRIWEQVLGVKNVGVTDHFNQVGGNSLAAVRVFMRIVKEFGRRLPLVTMLKHDTVEQLAVLLREPVHAETWSCIVPFTTTATGAPIFCPHAQTGNVLIYQHFAKEVAAHHPVYGIQAVGNWGTQEPHESIAEMVSYYVEEILKVRPHGPYIFLGGSLGGWIALDLALAMKERGHEVLMLAMYDTSGPSYPRYSLYGRAMKLIREHGGIPAWRLRRIFSKDAEYGRSARTIYWRLRETARWWLENTRRDYLYWKFEHRNAPHDFPMPANLTRVRLASRRVISRYSPRFYPGKITYFRATIRPAGVLFDPMNGWKGMSTEFEVHVFPGGHTGGMSYPVVKDLARTFLECVERDSLSSRAAGR